MLRNANILKACAAWALATGMLGGCSTKAWYEIVQTIGSQQCDQVRDQAARKQCYQDKERTKEDYDRLRKKGESKP